MASKAFKIAAPVQKEVVRKPTDKKQTVCEVAKIGRGNLRITRVALGVAARFEVALPPEEEGYGTLKASRSRKVIFSKEMLAARRRFTKSVTAPRTTTTQRAQKKAAAFIKGAQKVLNSKAGEDPVKDVFGAAKINYQAKGRGDLSPDGAAVASGILGSGRSSACPARRG